MINSYGLHGMGDQAVELFNHVPTNLLTEFTYASVLNACSHSGLIDGARRIFHRMPIVYKDKYIYTIMVDAYSRSHLINEAQELIDEFEKQHTPSLPMYMSMLSAARNQRNTDLVQRIFDRFKNQFSDYKDFLVSATIIIANTYALSNEHFIAFQIRTDLRQSSLKEVVGLNFTVINGKIFKFRAHDRTHPDSDKIYAELDRMSNQLVQHGHNFNSSWISRPIMTDENIEALLCGHSEKLAIALNFIQRPAPSRIQITKNLRVCGDCHAATKLIAQIRQCSIIVRDANRIHHFYPNGQCSCQGHF